jgi:hypothetical protein
MLNYGVTSLTSKQHEVVAPSTTKSEYVAINRAGQGVEHSRQLMQNINRHQRGATIVYKDNEGVVKLAKNPMDSNRTEYIDIKHYYIRELVDTKTIGVVSVGPADVVTDGLTKALPEPKHTIIFR